MSTTKRAFYHPGRGPRLTFRFLECGKQAEAKAVRPGQIRLVVAGMKAPFTGTAASTCGPPLAETDKVEVTLTVDAGTEDAEVKQREGVEAQRQGRILRLLEEALEQGGVLTQEDLARALGVNRRTIIRDVKALKAAEHLVHTRGQLKGVGRGARQAPTGSDHQNSRQTEESADHRRVECATEPVYGTIQKYLREREQETDEVLPLKGYRMDQGSRPTHKGEVIRLYEQGLEPPDIARETSHSLKRALVPFGGDISTSSKG